MLMVMLSITRDFLVSNRWCFIFILVLKAASGFDTPCAFQVATNCCIHSRNYLIIDMLHLGV